MAKHKSLFVFFFILLAGSIALGVFLIFKTFVDASSISGTVTKVVDTPSASEDGYYRISILAKSGQTYIVDATGYRNIPASPDKYGEACVEIPTVAVGDKVSFALPQSRTHTNTYHICHPKSETGYFFELN